MLAPQQMSSLRLISLGHPVEVYIDPSLLLLSCVHARELSDSIRSTHLSNRFTKKHNRLRSSTDCCISSSNSLFHSQYTYNDRKWLSFEEISKKDDPSYIFDYTILTELPNCLWSKLFPKPMVSLSNDTNDANYGLKWHDCCCHTTPERGRTFVLMTPHAPIKQ